MITTEYNKELLLRELSNREYKASVFTSFFSEPKNALELYKALSDSENATEQDIELQTLQGVMFMARKNDLAFTALKKVLILAEHQSTVNENMPLRSIIYCGRTLEKLIRIGAEYRTRLVRIPTPEFYSFYNGTKPQPAEKILYLSDAYLDQTDTPMLQLAVRVININLSTGHPILSKCRPLYEYSYFIQAVRDQLANGLGRDDAITAAMQHCIRMNIMADFLQKHGSEVINMLLTEFNVDTAIEVWHEEGVEEGIQQGVQQGIQQESLRSIASTIRLCRRFNRSRNETLELVMSEHNLTQDEAEKHMAQHWT